MKNIITLFFFLSVLNGFAQNASNDSILKPNIATYTFQQTESVNIFFDSNNSKFVIENNTRQFHNFFVGIYDLTGNPILETKIECYTGKNIDIPVNLRPGLYIINVVDKPFVYTKKIVIH